MKTGLNTIVQKSTVRTASEASGINTIWSNLLAESRFAGCSKPERDDAIQRIKYAISNYEMREWHENVLNGIISILRIDPC